MIKINGYKIAFEKFPNGETRMTTEDIILGLSMPYFLQSENNIVVDFKYEDDSELIKLMFVKEFLNSFTKKSIRLNILYMPYSRMDRSENGSPFTLKYISKFINSLGFDEVEVIEPHSDVTIALLDNAKANYINFQLIENVKKMVEFNEDNDYIVFPDSGAQKRYSKMKAKNILVCYKNRDFETGKITSLELVGDTNGIYGKTAIIVDDLSSYGGTFVHTANKLREQGFVEIYLLVAHAENSIFKGELFNHVDKVFTTNSILNDIPMIEQYKFSNKLYVFKI